MTTTFFLGGMPKEVGDFFDKEFVFFVYFLFFEILGPVIQLHDDFFFWVDQFEPQRLRIALTGMYSLYIHVYIVFHSALHAHFVCLFSVFQKKSFLHPVFFYVVL